MSGLDLIITITDRSTCELFINWFRGRDIPLVLTALGQGTATTEILDCLGLEASEKSVLFCLAPHSRCMVRRAARDLWLDVPGNGVLMTVPVSSIGGTSVIIMVGVALETVKQIESQMMMRHYKGFLD